MDKLDELENLREELKRKVDLLIDEAINQVKGMIAALYHFIHRNHTSTRYIRN